MDRAEHMYMPFLCIPSTYLTKESSSFVRLWQLILTHLRHLPHMAVF